MYRPASSIPLASIAAGIMVFAFPASVDAGQFKTLNTESLGVGGSVEATSSPKNTGPAMDMEVFEFRTAAAGGTYSCRILANSTGRILNIHLVGTGGRLVSSCSADPLTGGTCSTAPTLLLGDRKFHCVVASSIAVIGVNPTYVMSVNRS
jgi:hypothetical protein